MAREPHAVPAWVLALLGVVAPLAAGLLVWSINLYTAGVVQERRVTAVEQRLDLERVTIEAMNERQRAFEVAALQKIGEARDRAEAHATELEAGRQNRLDRIDEKLSELSGRVAALLERTAPGARREP